MTLFWITFRNTLGKYYRVMDCFIFRGLNLGFQGRAYEALIKRCGGVRSCVAKKYTFNRPMKMEQFRHLARWGNFATLSYGAISPPCQMGAIRHLGRWGNFATLPDLLSASTRRGPLNGLPVPCQLLCDFPIMIPPLRWLNSFEYSHSAYQFPILVREFDNDGVITFYFRCLYLADVLYNLSVWIYDQKYNFTCSSTYTCSGIFKNFWFGAKYVILPLCKIKIATGFPILSSQENLDTSVNSDDKQ